MGASKSCFVVSSQEQSCKCDVSPSFLERKKFWFDTKVISEASFEIAKTYELFDNILGSLSLLSISFSAYMASGAIAWKKSLSPKLITGFVIASGVGYAMKTHCKFDEKAKSHHKVGALYGPIARAAQRNLENSCIELWKELNSKRDRAQEESIVQPRWVYGYASHLVLYKQDPLLSYQDSEGLQKISPPKKWRYFLIFTSMESFTKLRYFKTVWDEKINSL